MMERPPANDGLVFFEKVFLKRLHPDAKLRGVELFNLGLVHDLAAAGQRLFIPAHASPRRDSAEPRPRGCSGLGEPRPALPSF